MRQRKRVAESPAGYPTTVRVKRSNRSPLEVDPHDQERRLYKRRRQSGKVHESLKISNHRQMMNQTTAKKVTLQAHQSNLLFQLPKLRRGAGGELRGVKKVRTVGNPKTTKVSKGKKMKVRKRTRTVLKVTPLRSMMVAKNQRPMQKRNAERENHHHLHRKSQVKDPGLEGESAIVKRQIRIRRHRTSLPQRRQETRAPQVLKLGRASVERGLPPKFL